MHFIRFNDETEIAKSLNSLTLIKSPLINKCPFLNNPFSTKIYENY